MGKTKNEKFRNDRALRFYSEVLGLERLHYGIWKDQDERTLEGAKVAQKRYEDFLIAQIAQIFPDGSQTAVLDVGCGTGVMSESLYKKGYQVEGLSPDLYQKEVFERRLPVKFHLARFQNFVPEKKYDLIIMSESAQYIPLKKLFARAKESLKSSGTLMVCDYFRLGEVSGPLGKSGHILSSFLDEAHSNGFEKVKEEDITQRTVSTLDAAKIFTERYILPSLDIASEKFREKYPFIFRSIKWLFRKKIDKAYENMVLIDSEEFIKHKCYMFYVFKAP
jgi:SAM-dependent methyltransferase